MVLGITAYFYDEVNRLVGIRGPEAEVAFGFDAYGRAISETVNRPEFLRVACYVA